MAVAITKRPTSSPTNLSAIKRENWKFSVSWKVPAAATDQKRNDRWDKQQYRWSIFTFDPYQKKKVVTEWVSRQVQNLNVSLTTTSAALTLNPKDYFPYTLRAIDRIEFFVEGWNRKGYRPNNDKFKPIGRYTFARPAVPKLSMKFNETTNAAECTITNSDPGTGATAQRQQTIYWMWRQDSKGVRSDNKYVNRTLLGEYRYNSLGSTNNSYTTRTDIGIGQQIQYGQWVRVYWEVRNQGLGGFTDPSSWISHVFAYPAKASITNIVISNTKNPFDPTGTVSVWLKTNHNADTAPVDEVRLQRLRNSTAATAQAAGIESGWADVDGAVDNANCTGLSDTAADAIPDVGKHTWYRIKSTHDNLTVYSSPVEATAFFRKQATAADDSVTIISCDGDRDGTSIEVKLGWKNDDAAGTEISWAEFEDSWTSTSQPSTYKVTWKDATSKDSRFANTASVVIRGLTEGTKYYIKARRYLTPEGGSETFGKYNSAPQTYWPTVPTKALAGSELKDVQLYVQQPIIRGRDTSANWTYDSEETQTGWELHAIRVSPRYSDTIIAQGTDSMNAATIKADIFKNDRDIAFKLRMTTGGNWVENSNDVGTGSASNRIQIFDYPACPKFATQTVSAQPLSLYMTSKTGNEDFIFTITSKGTVQQAPDRVRVQADGDVIYSNRLSPSWTLKNGLYSAKVVFPTGLDFVDNSSYILSVTAVDRTSGLKSSTGQSLLKVKWAHQAVPPNTKSKIVANPNSKTVTITPMAPAKASKTDVCDIYRMTPDGAQLLASGVTFGYKVVDRWAPYSKTVPLSYRLVTRTADGDIEFRDIPYRLAGYSIRFDWADRRSLEIPFNLTYNDSYEKDFEERSHLGETQSAGFWNDSYKRKSSISTQMVRLFDPQQVRLARELAQYAGPVFVRLPNACSFMANVNVDGIDTNYESLVLDVSFTATEVMMNDTFRAASSDITKK